MESFPGKKASKCPMMIITRRSTKKNNFSDREFKSIQVAQCEMHGFLNTSITMMIPHFLMSFGTLLQLDSEVLVNMKKCHINGTDDPRRLL